MGVEHVQTIVDMRRHLVMEEASMPESAMTALLSMEQRGHPWRGTTSSRLDWAQGLDVRTLAEHPQAEVLFWVGCTAALEERSQSVARSMASVLKRAGVDFAVLGHEETCTGDPARRMGNEYLYQILAQQNIETLNRYEVKTIVTVCPHCFNTMKNEYPHLGGSYTVMHYSEFVSRLIQEGRIKPLVTVEASVAYHDSCYLGRQNGVYDPPREIARVDPRRGAGGDGAPPRAGVLLRRRRRPHVGGGEPRQARQPRPHRPVPGDEGRHRGRLLSLLPPDVRGGDRLQRERRGGIEAGAGPAGDPGREPGPREVTARNEGRAEGAVRAVLFDADGVLQTTPRFLDMAAGLLPAGDDDIDGFLADLLEVERPALVGNADLPAGVAKLLRDRGSSASLEEAMRLWTEIAVDPGTRAVVEELRAGGMRCYLASNQHWDRARYMSEALGYRELFDAEFYSCDLGRAKPSADYFRLVLEGVGLPPGEVLFLDDKRANVEAARGIGIRASVFEIQEGADNRGPLLRVLSQYGVRLA